MDKMLNDDNKTYNNDKQERTYYMRDVYDILLEILVHALDAGFKGVGRIFPLRGTYLLEFGKWRMEILWGSQRIYICNYDEKFARFYDQPFNINEIVELLYSITGAYLPDDIFDVEDWTTEER
jgi:hypothetical protein